MMPETHAKTSAHASPRPREMRNFFSVRAAGAMFGLPVDAVQTIFRLQAITPVPLGPPTIAGLVNLRGKIVTAVSLARRLGLDNASAPAKSEFAVAVERRGETFALLVDSVGDAMECGEEDSIEPPRHVESGRARVTASYYRVDGGILPVLDIEALFDIAPAGVAENRTNSELSK
ncbi:MAG: chemotaxis protein CheW [Hyphomicrobiales bacterium]|nr:chemotaxis protein CheW [Hyphomicrobiales bacterium]